MATNITMPKLGMTMTEGTITSWEKKEGDEIKKGETLLWVTTDKVNVEIEAPETGVLLSIKVDSGEKAAVGQIIGIIGEMGEESYEDCEKGQPEKEDMYIGPQMDLSKKVRATPAARIAASKHCVDINRIKGTGISGRILKDDVDKYVVGLASKSGENGNAWRDVDLSEIENVSASRMTESFANVPHFYLVAKAHTGKMNEMLQTAREKMLKKGAPKATFTDVLIWMLSRVIPRHQRVNAQWLGNGKIRIFEDVNIGIAVATHKGLLVPIIKRSGNMSFDQIVTERAKLVERARNGKLMPDDMAGGTITVSNLGMYGIDMFNGIINTPQSALLAVGGIDDGMITMSLSLDHRVIDGAAGAEFLKDLKEIMENPEKLLDEYLF